jgi:hypothetical protein
MKAVDDLGAALEQQWRRANYDEHVFPELAVDALVRADLVQRLDPWSIVRWISTAPSLPAQQDDEDHFSDLPITLFAGSRFYIDAYFWLDGTTTIHQHAFSGAFQVMLGGSVHSRYQFRDERIVNEHLSIGTIALEDVELLGRGDVRPIRPGRAQIHSLFHLDRPSVTITVRSEHAPSAAAQYDYYRPHIACHAYYKNSSATKIVRSVALLLAMKHPDADRMITEAVCGADFHTAYLVLAETYRHLTPTTLEALFGVSRGRERFAAILDCARAVHGPLVDVVMPVLEEDARQRNIIARRTAITGDTHRFLLALLLNVPDKRRMLDLVAARAPGADPVERVLAWVQEMAGIAVFGSHESNVLGIDRFGEGHVRALRASLLGEFQPADAGVVDDLHASVLGVLM